MAAKVNLIPFNPFPGAPYQRSKPEVIAAFSKILRDRKVFATTRKTRGDDIDAACGQLVGKVVSKQKNRLSGIPVVVRCAASSHAARWPLPRYAGALQGLTRLPSTNSSARSFRRQ